MKRKIAAITSSRADYGHLYWLLKEMTAEPHLELKIIVMGAHLSAEFGSSDNEIERDGFAIDERIECLLSSDTDVGMAKTIGMATLGLADALARIRPDVLYIFLSLRKTTGSPAYPVTTSNNNMRKRFSFMLD